MTRPFKAIIDILSYDGAVTNNPVDATKIKGLVEETNVSELFRRQESVADEVTDQSIPLPDASSDYLVIFVDQIVSVKLNGSSDAITLNPKASGTKTPVLFLRGTVSALTVTNDSGSTANFDIISVNI